MAKASKKNSLKLPKRLLGVKLPKKSRKSINRILKATSSDDANPLVVAAVGAVVTMLAERLQQPLEALLTHDGTAARRTRPSPVAKH